MPIFSEGRVLPVPSRADRNVQKISNGTRESKGSKGHCIGFMVLDGGPGVRVSSESFFEQGFKKILAARPDISDVREQVLFRYGRKNERCHFFDILATKTDGSRIAYTVKPAAKLASGRFVEEMQTIAWWVQKKGFADALRLLSDTHFDRVELHNANLNAALHDCDAEADAVSSRIAEELRGAATLRSLTEQVDLGARGYRALLRLVARGVLAPVTRERINPETLVAWTGARA
ncbi:hypothetical protein SAMN05444279_11468 [Ruegeria intermedia]|uniref:Uncharacterized protein n=1 Tax=Ruegeria intermedia TaxID=996115 RepID=A0A1M4Y977_9RHOB|nr:hypothetical protein [Ruegeria intermedia]SHF02163.1 hypothetical protein SAMN05444279_11468 [Ruegeria intermedia]